MAAVIAPSVHPTDPRQTRYLFRCPGCGKPHAFDGRWTWNGSVEAPTFSPSLLVRWNEGPESREHVCHSFVTDGQIRYLDDCTHALRGSTVPLPPWAP